jgi:hypothetical protein
MDMPLPSFLGIGAVKAGSTTLHQCLDAHPDVFSQKEVRFFNLHWDKGVGWYAKHFEAAPAGRVLGEVCAGYSQHPWRSGVPERIAQVLPDVRLVYVVRDPIERIRSHYRQHVLGGAQRLPLREAVERDPNYLWCSRYAYQIDQYLELFPREQLLVITDQQLSRDRRGTLAQLYKFVGADPDWWTDEVGSLRANVTDKERITRHGVKRLAKLPGVRRAVEALPPSLNGAVRRVTHFDATQVPVEIEPDLRNELELALRDDVSRLRAHVNGDFDGWGIG